MTITSKINLEAVTSALGKISHVVNELTPVAEALGVPMAGPLGNIISAAIELGDNATTAIANGQAVATSRDEMLIKSALLSLQQKNDELAKLVAAS